MDSQKVQEKKKHLIVLLPVSLVNDVEMAHMIHWMAFQKNCDVVYLTAEDSSDGSLALSRDMATMKAVTAGNWLSAQWIQASPADWLARLQEIYQPGDEIMCTEEQTIDHGMLQKEKLYDLVKETTEADIQLVSGFYPVHKAKKKRGIPEFLALMGFLVIIALFAFLQIQVDSAIHGTVGTVIVLILLCVEFGAIWVWNNHTI